MAAKVQSKNYVPEYYAMDHLNDERNSNWCWFYRDKTINEHLYDKHTQRQANGYSEYEKERLKRTMLEHEATFKKQVYELHRLYRIQKELMVECQSRIFSRSSLPLFASQSKCSTNHPNQSDSHLIWKSSDLPMRNNCYGKVSDLGTNNVKIETVCLDRDNSKSDFIAVKNNCFLKVNKLVENNSKRHCRRMFDLHLPADAYIDIEGAETSRKNYVAALAHTVPVSHNGICTGHQENDFSLALGGEKGANIRENGRFSELKTENSMKTDSMSNLEDMTTKEYDVDRKSEKSDFVQFLCPEDNSVLNQGNHLAISSATNSVYKHGDKLTAKDFFHLDEEARKEKLFFRNESVSVKTMDLYLESRCPDTSSRSSGPILLNPSKTYQIHSTGKDEPESSFSKMSVNSYEASTRIQLTSLNCSNSESPSMLSSFPVPKDLVNSMRRPNAGQELGIRTSMSPQNYATLDQWQHCRDLNLIPGAAEATPKLNVISDYKNLGHGPLKFNKNIKFNRLNSLKKINLNQAISSIDVDSGATADQDLAICTNNKVFPRDKVRLIKRKFSSEPVGSSTFSAKLDLNGSNDQFQVKAKYEAVVLQLERKEENSLNLSRSNTRNFSLPLQIIGHKIQKNEVSDHQNVSSDALTNQSQQASLFPSFVSNDKQPSTGNNKCKEIDAIRSSNASSDFRMTSSTREISVGGVIAENSASNKSKDLRYHINLNLEAACSDEEMIPEKAVAEFRSTFVSSHTKSNDGIHSKVRHLADTSLETGWSADTLVKMAARNIVAMSMDQKTLSDVIDHDLYPCCDTLCWFADFAVSNSERPEMIDGWECNQRYLPHDDLDVFEAMTLQLEALPVPECSYNPIELMNKSTDDEDIGVASLLFTKPRRGQARRRRQRKDFQKDILPSLASLSRLEVSEDLQVIGELMKASGSPRQSRLTRRCTSRKGAGKRKIKDSTTTVSFSVSESQLSSDIPVQPTCTELEVTASAMIRWGRRCRRQRTLAGNLVTPLA